jgi:hypothetical protein
LFFNSALSLLLARSTERVPPWRAKARLRSAARSSDAWGRTCPAARVMPSSRPSCPSCRSRSGPGARSRCTTTARRARLRRVRGCSSCTARAEACCSTRRWYATQGLIPRLAGPSQVCYSHFSPRLGQIAHFAPAGHEIVAFDYVGCGRSPKPQSWYAWRLLCRRPASPLLPPNPAKTVRLPSNQVRLLVR